MKRRHHRKKSKNPSPHSPSLQPAKKKPTTENDIILRCSRLIQDFPGDMWIQIFSVNRWSQSLEELLDYGKVSRSWKLASDHVILRDWSYTIIGIPRMLPKLISLTPLKKLTIGRDCPITDDELRSLTDLESLTVNNSTKITGNGISELTTLKSLDVGGPACGGQPMVCLDLKRFTRLETLHLGFLSGFTDDSLIGIGGTLRDFSVRDGKLTDSSFSTLTNLTSLSLIGSAMTDLSFRLLSSLTSLSLCDSKVTISSLACPQKLKRLSLSYSGRKCLILDEGLRNLENLKYLQIDAVVKIEDETIFGLKKLRNVQLVGKHLDLSLDALSKIPSLRNLGVFEGRWEEDLLRGKFDHLIDLCVGWTLPRCSE